MSKKVLFNFFNSQKTILALCEHFDLPIRAVKLYLINRNLDYETCVDFIKNFHIPAHQVDVTNTFITVKHITTFHDNGASLKKYGLVNLKSALELETPIKDFLEENGVKIDINNQQIIINKNIYPILRYEDMNFSKYKKAINELHIKLYHDKCETEAFLCGEENELNNYPHITQYPEILNSIDNLLKALEQPLSLTEKWAQLQNGKYYILEFNINLTALEFVNSKPSFYEDVKKELDLFGYSENQFELDLIPKRLYSNIFLIENSIDVFFTGKGKDFGQIFPNTLIQYTDIKILEKLNY